MPQRKAPQSSAGILPAFSQGGTAFAGFAVYRSASGQSGTFQRINAALVQGGAYEDAHLPWGTYYYQVYLITADGTPVQWTGIFSGKVGGSRAAGDWADYQ